MRKICKVFVIKNYHYQNDMNEALEIANNEGNHGDIICGNDYHMNSTSIIYKLNNKIYIIKALDLNEFPKTVNTIPIEISKYVKKPEIFYKNLLDEFKSFKKQETFISTVILCETHKKFILNYTSFDIENYIYSIDTENLWKRNKNDYYDLKCFNYKK